MLPALHLAPLAAFAALMAAAAVEDFRRLVIANRLVVALCLLWPVQLATGSALAPLAVLSTLAGAAAIFAVGALIFSRGMIGGGDVKLLSAAALWAGAEALPSLLILTALFGGLLSLLLLSPLGPRLRADRGGADAPALGAARPPVPYGAAIAAAALVVTVPPSLG
jgi:prepilin peptidase CpaA